jgi:hypothetical protein
MTVGMGVAVGVPVIVAVGAGMRCGLHEAMLHYNITKVHRS